MKKITYLPLAILCLESSALAASFNMDFLSGESAKADLSRFEQNTLMADGKYELDIYVNNDWRGRIPVQLVDNNHNVLISSNDIENLGIEVDNEIANKEQYLPLKSFLHDGSYQLDVASFKLNINIPQAYLIQHMNGYISPDYWDQGISGAFVSYNSNYFHSQNKQNGSRNNNDSAYISLNSGINLFGWQFRDQSIYNYNNQNAGQWHNNNRYVQKGIPSINSELRAGDSYTNSESFDSIFFRGISLKTDLRMYPDAYQGFSPTVHGVAQSNAVIDIYQDNILIFQTSVPPGPFTIKDLLPTGSGGDLNVEVKEANGSINRFIVPFSAVPNMLKEGMSKYEFTAGEARIDNSKNRPNFIQASYQYGINNLLTGYNGAIVSKDYYSVLLGGGFNLPVGALSIDITHAESRFSEIKNKKGQSYKIAYSRYFNQSGTNFSLAAYRYSTKDYLTLSDSIALHNWVQEGNYAGHYSHQKNTFNINMNQNLGQNLGSIFVSGTVRDYWGESNNSQEFQLGYNNNWQKINYSITASRISHSDNSQESTKPEQRYYLNLSFPFSLFEQQAYMTTNVGFNDGQYNNSNIGISSTVGDHHQLNYNLNFAHQHAGNTTLNSSLSYKTQIATLNSSYSHSDQYQQLGLGASGSLVAFSGGILTSNQLGETFAIINAPGVKNAAINGDKTMTTNNNGIALVPYLSAYRKNAVMLDSSNLEEDSAELIGNIKDVVPYAGAITYIDFKTDKRHNYIFRAYRDNGKPLPFGTEVTDKNNQILGYVGQGSTIFIKADKLPEQLFISINKETQTKCTISHPELIMDDPHNICLEEQH
ncbi:fimbria/pilus outer membrane usher protein [Moellerella wisconsensis]|uniref:fimbria/pilus outer membrane usher protein n=1 Tax=Moellerella wisconsensis TaxID=158849 RepID=UPI001F4E9E82|nr:fimbria/pilus outer membrane usher protein [Moellerella wisconsensis]UNH24309.1 fimbrial biogenesis outer membrane usher protein [Moellerella wisconsensis]